MTDITAIAKTIAGKYDVDPEAAEKAPKPSSSRSAKPTTKKSIRTT